MLPGLNLYNSTAHNSKAKLIYFSLFDNKATFYRICFSFFTSTNKIYLNYPVRNGVPETVFRI